MTNKTNDARLVQAETGSQSATLVNAAYSMAALFARLFGRYFRITVLADMVIKAGVEDAEVRCRQEIPDSKPTYSRLVMMTGVSLTRLKAMRDEPKELGDRHICTEAAVLAYWHNCMHDIKTREPAVLPIFGYVDSLQGVVAKVGGRGVSVQTVLPRLVANGNVELVGKHDVRLLNPNWRFVEDNEDTLLAHGVRSVASLVDTIDNNLVYRHEPDKKRMERRVYSYYIDEAIYEQAQDELNVLLLKQQQELSEFIRSKEGNSRNAKGRVLGAGYYLWGS